MKDVLSALKKRVRVFEKLIEKEDNAIKRLRYKSRRLRMTSNHGIRRGWYTDRLQELQLVIKLIDGSVAANEFIHHKLDDSLGQIICAIGDGCDSYDGGGLVYINK